MKKLLNLKNKFRINISENARNIIDKILLLLFFTTLFRFLSAIPVPGVPLEALKQILSQYSFGEILNITSSGALSNTTLIAIGLAPYINASVILQLLGTIIPKLQELQKEGTRGRMVINMYTRILTVPLAILQSFGIYLFLKQYGLIYPQGLSVLYPEELAVLVASFTGGSLLLMWLSELITEDKFVNGSSYLIAAGILADIPGKLSGGISSNSWYITAITIAVTVLWIGFIIYVTEAERQVTIKYAKIMTFGSKPIKDNHLPLRLNQAGVMPVIFAMSFLSTPSLIMDIVSKSDLVNKYSWISSVSNFVNSVSNSGKIYYNLILTILIILFSLFYTFVVFNPDETSKNFQKQGAYIPGVRPGNETKKYLTKIMIRLGIVGSMFLAFITLIPMIVPKILSNRFDIAIPIFFSGTGILIVIGVMSDMFDKARSMKTETYTITGI